MPHSPNSPSPPGEPAKRIRFGSEAPAPVAKVQPPTIRQQAWNLTLAIGAFIADGCQTVSEAEYSERLTVCDACEFRSNHRCLQCGCQLAIKARGRAWECPAGRWPPKPKQGDTQR